MYSKIRVPLDGSKHAECVLPHLETFIRGCQVKEVMFVRAVEPFHLPRRNEYVLPPEDVDKINAQTTTEARDYLKRLAAGFHFSGVQTSWEVLTGRLAQEIGEYASRHAFDWIPIATHGRSGVSRWARGAWPTGFLDPHAFPS